MPTAGGLPQRVLQWLGRQLSLRRQQDQELKRRLPGLHQRYPAMGLDSLYHLIRKELPCSRKRIHRLMNELNISSSRRLACKVATNSKAHPIAPNLPVRRFSFDKPDFAWVGDITYIPTNAGWLCCTIVKDLCTKQVVGYAFSDRSVQYAALPYRQRLADLEIRQSMSRKGDPFDNAVAENFFTCLRSCIHKGKSL